MSVVAKKPYRRWRTNDDNGKTSLGLYRLPSRFGARSYRGRQQQNGCRSERAGARQLSLAATLSCVVTAGPDLLPALRTLLPFPLSRLTSAHRLQSPQASRSRFSALLTSTPAFSTVYRASVRAAATRARLLQRPGCQLQRSCLSPPLRRRTRSRTALPQPCCSPANAPKAPQGGRRVEGWLEEHTASPGSGAAAYRPCSFTRRGSRYTGPRVPEQVPAALV